MLLMHIRIAPGLSSVAVKVKLTALLFVASAPALIAMEPVGGLLSGLGFVLAVAPVETLPALSMAHTRYPYFFPLVSPSWMREVSAPE